MECTPQRTWRKQKRSVRQTVVALPYAAQVVLRYSRLTNRTGRQIQELVAVVVNHRIKIRDADLRPIAANHRKNVPDHWQDLPQHIGSERMYENMENKLNSNMAA